MANGNIVFCLPTYFEPLDKRSTGGTISNYFLINELSKYKKIEVISPIVSSKLVHDINPRIKITTKHGLDGNSFFIKAIKKFWLNKQIKTRLLQKDNSVYIGTNGTATFINNYQPDKLIILTRAYEEFLEYKVDGENAKEIFRKKLFSFFIKNKVDQAYRSAKKIITNSKFMKKEICTYFKIEENKVNVLYPPIMISEGIFRSMPKSRKLIIGMLNPKKIKGEDIFLGLAKEMKNIDFIYFSKEDKRYDIQNVKYMGWGSDSKKMFGSFDLLIAPSLWNEPFGRVAVEGIRNGLPVLVSNHGGIPETVDSEFVVIGDEVINWKNKIEWLQNNELLVLEAWERSIILSENFIVSKHNEEIIKCFKEFLN